MTKLFLDDEREPFDNSWEVVRTPLHFIENVELTFEHTGKIPDIVSFDHDLYPEHYHAISLQKDIHEYNKMYKKFTHWTGRECADWLCRFCVEKGIRLPKVNIHSLNIVGANNISHVFLNYALFHYDEELIINPLPYPNNPEL